MLSLSRALARGAARAAPEIGFVRAAATSAATPAAAAKPVVEKEFLVYRWNPDDGEAPKYQTYKVDINS